MHIEHIALWTTEIERLRHFYETYFGARATPVYRSIRRPGFLSYFLEFNDHGARIELMTLPDLCHGTQADDGHAAGFAHLALSTGSRRAVDDLTARLKVDGFPVPSQPRLTGDGYYESVVKDPDGNFIEIVA